MTSLELHTSAYKEWLSATSRQHQHLLLSILFHFCFFSKDDIIFIRKREREREREGERERGREGERGRRDFCTYHGCVVCKDLTNIIPKQKDCRRNYYPQRSRYHHCHPSNLLCFANISVAKMKTDSYGCSCQHCHFKSAQKEQNLNHN